MIISASVAYVAFNMGFHLGTENAKLDVLNSKELTTLESIKCSVEITGNI